MIEIKNLKISANGYDVFKNLSLEIDDGNSCAVFLGKGCGKTMLSAAIAGAIDADDGEICIDGAYMDTENSSLKGSVGFYSADVDMPGFLSVYEALSFFGSARGASDEALSRQIDEALSLVDLTELSSCSVASLSPYYRAKLGIATTLMGKPSLLIYDDIFKGLSESDTEQLIELVKLIASKKQTVLICSSPLAASKCCSHALFIDNDRVVLSGSIEGIEREINKTVKMKLEIKGDRAEIENRLSGMPEIAGVCSVGDDERSLFEIEYYDDSEIKDKLFAAMAEIGAPILSYEGKRLTLVDVYRSLINDASGEAEKKDEK